MDTAAAKRPVEDMDDYRTAAAYLMEKALASGDGHALRAVKTLMDERERLVMEARAIAATLLMAWKDKGIQYKDIS